VSGKGRGAKRRRDIEREGQAVADYYTRALERAFNRAGAARARDVHALSMSQIGKCLRQSAFKVAGTPPDASWREQYRREAEIGTWLHEGLLPALRERDSPAPGAEGPTSAVCATSTNEVPLVLRAAGLEVAGTYDGYEPDAPHGPTLMDLKTVGDWMWNRVLDPRQGMPQEYVWQSMAYATALLQQGKPVEWLVWLFEHRATGEDWVVVRPFTPDDALAVLRRVADIVRASAAPLKAPKEAPGPSAWLKQSFSPCDSCAWLEQCWGQARPGVAPQAAVARETPQGAQRAVAAYAAQRTVKVSGEEGMAFSRAVMTGVPAGVYEDPDHPGTWWQYKRTSNGSVRVAAAKPPAKERPHREAAEAASDRLALIVACSTDQPLEGPAYQEVDDPPEW
jgi:hypothetical protein